jgi:replication-associated recombination protein RarA
MYFCGREKEISKIINALKKKKHIVITGKFGIGKTVLARHLSDITKQRWQFVFTDFSKSPSNVCNDILWQISPKKQPKYRHKYIKYKTARSLIAELTLKDKRQPVIVLDNISELSHQKLAFIRYVTFSKKLLFIAIAEGFLPENVLFQLRACLMPSHLLKLGNLGTKNAVEFFHHVSQKNNLNWSEKQIRMLAEVTGGYPLGMRTLVKQEIEAAEASAIPAASSLERSVNPVYGTAGNANESKIGKIPYREESPAKSKTLKNW